MVGVVGVVPGVATGAVGAVVAVDHLFGALVAAHRRHAPFRQGGTGAVGIVQRVEHQPEIVLLGAAGHCHLLGDGAAVVPVVPCGLLLQGCVGLHLVDAQAFAVRGDEVVAVAVPLLVVVAGVAGAVPDAEGVEAAVGAEVLQAGGVGGGVECQVGVALRHNLGGALGGVGAEVVDFGPAVGLVVAGEVLRVVGVALAAVEPVVVAVGDGEIALGAQPLGSAAKNECQQYQSPRVCG